MVYYSTIDNLETKTETLMTTTITPTAQARIAASGRTEVASQLEARMKIAAARSIGKEISIQVDKTRTIKGTISRCEPADIRAAGAASIRATFNVWVLVGLNKIERGPFHVTRIPG